MLTYERRSSKADFIQSSILWFSYDLVSNIFFSGQRYRANARKRKQEFEKREKERERERKGEKEWAKVRLREKSYRSYRDSRRIRNCQIVIRLTIWKRSNRHVRRKKTNKTVFVESCFFLWTLVTKMQRSKKVYHPASKIYSPYNDLIVPILPNVRKGNKTMYIFRVHLYLNVQVA